MDESPALLLVRRTRSAIQIIHGSMTQHQTNLSNHLHQHDFKKPSGLATWTCKSSPEATFRGTNRPHSSPTRLTKLDSAWAGSYLALEAHHWHHSRPKTGDENNQAVYVGNVESLRWFKLHLHSVVSPRRWVTSEENGRVCNNVWGPLAQERKARVAKFVQLAQPRSLSIWRQSDAHCLDCVAPLVYSGRFHGNMDIKVPTFTCLDST